MTITRLAQAKRLVIKVGSALVTNNGEGLDLNAITEWARQISRLRQDGKEVVLVSAMLHRLEFVYIGVMEKNRQQKDMSLLIFL